MRISTVVVLGTLIVMFPFSAGSQTSTVASAAAASRRAVELTYLRSFPGQRVALKRFIELNWFAMDAIAKARGLMVDYRILDTGTDEGEWNLLVYVTYADERGYDGIAPEFEAIRALHKPVPVDGRTLRELGTIVNSVRAYEDVRVARGETR